MNYLENVLYYLRKIIIIIKYSKSRKWHLGKFYYIIQFFFTFRFLQNNPINLKDSNRVFYFYSEILVYSSGPNFFAFRVSN